MEAAAAEQLDRGAQAKPGTRSLVYQERSAGCTGGEMAECLVKLAWELGPSLEIE